MLSKEEKELLNIPPFLRRDSDRKTNLKDAPAPHKWFMPDLSQYERQQKRKNVAQINALYALRWSKGAIHRMPVDRAVEVIKNKMIAPPRNRARAKRK